MDVRNMFSNDSAIARHLDGDDDEHDQERDEASSTATGSNFTQDVYPSMPNNTVGAGSSFNTGVKGVREDARQFEEARKAQEEYRRAQHAFSVEKRAMTTTTWSQDQEEADAKERWMEKRMKELSKHGDRRFGRVEEVDAERYVEAVETSGLVCVLIFDETQESDDVVECLNAIAARYPGQRFVRMHRHEAEMDEVAVPAILAYENGELIANLVRIVDEIPINETLNRAAFEKIFYANNILKADNRERSIDYS